MSSLELYNLSKAKNHTAAPAASVAPTMLKTTDNPTVDRGADSETAETLGYRTDGGRKSKNKKNFRNKKNGKKKSRRGV